MHTLLRCGHVVQKSDISSRVSEYVYPIPVQPRSVRCHEVFGKYVSNVTFVHLVSLVVLSSQGVTDETSSACTTIPTGHF